MGVGYPAVAIIVVIVAALIGTTPSIGPQQVTDGVGPVDVTLTVSPGELSAGGTVTLTVRVRTASGSSSLPVVIRFLRPDGWLPRHQGIDEGRGSYICRGPTCSDEHRLELQPNSDGVAVATVEYRVPPGSVAGSHDVGLLISVFPYDDAPLTETVSITGPEKDVIPSLGFVAKVATVLGTLVAVAEFTRRRRGRRGDGT